MVSLALAWPSAAPAAFAGRNGDLLFAKETYPQATRPSDIYAIRPGDASVRRLTRTKSGESDPAASPDGTLIAYTGPGSQIWTMRKDVSHRRAIARGGEPAWSPNGKRIVFVGPRAPRGHRPAIYTMRADGTHLRRLTNDRNASNRSPAFSPDGKRIVFVSNRDATDGPGNVEIWVMDTKGKHAVDLTHSAYIDDHPSWSPDGRWILFERSGAWVDPAPLFVMRPDGSDQHQVGTLAGRMPTWSPDGKRIAYVRYGSETNPLGDPPEILRANADGTDVQLVTRLGSGWVLEFQSRIDWRVR
jgi:Tol biopolymer transport system component